ncbi:MAG TPA: hypothetical protein PKX93_09820, partial [bacterium]|nr:hypothetical protein [bacterium]
MKLTQRILLLVWLLVATMLQAQTFSELQRSAEISFRKKEYFQAKTAALQAREKARTEEEKNAATLLLAGILSAMGEKQEARQEYQKILTSPASSAFQQAEALTGLARLLLSEKDFDQARGKLAKIFNLAVDEKIKNRALTDYLSTWVEISDMAGLKEAVSRLVEEKQESWPGYRIHLLSEAGRLLSSWRDWTVRDYRTSREYYRKILTLPEVSPATIFNTRLSIAKTYSAEGNPAAARKVLTEILSSKSLSMTEKTTVFREIAKTYTAEKDYNSARAVLEAALRAEDLPETTVGSILTEIAATYRSQEKLEEMARIVNRLVSLEAASDRDKIQQLFSLGDLYLKKRNYPGARESYGQVLQIKKATSGDRGEALSKLSQSCLLAREIATARGYLEQMREVPGLSEEQRLLVSLRIAGTYGAEGNIGWMKQEMAAAEKESKNLSLPQTINAYWKVSQFFLTSSDYPVVEEFLAKVNSLGSGSRKEYLCRYVSRAPVGVGGWFQSDLVKDKSNREARFYSYNIKDAAALLVADVTAQRPFAGENTGEKVGETAFYMACDREGWHIFVQADEPRIEKIVLENGRGASSLEMFFMPGENKDFYYQWIINLA